MDPKLTRGYPPNTLSGKDRFSFSYFLALDSKAILLSLGVVKSRAVQNIGFPLTLGPSHIRLTGVGLHFGMFG
jgi:hypothetical protein